MRKVTCRRGDARLQPRAESAERIKREVDRQNARSHLRHEHGEPPIAAVNFQDRASPGLQFGQVMGDLQQITQLGPPAGSRRDETTGRKGRMLGVADGHFVLVLGCQRVAHQISDSVFNAIPSVTNGAPQTSLDKANRATLQLRSKDQWTGVMTAPQKGQEVTRKFGRNYRNLLNT